MSQFSNNIREIEAYLHWQQERGQIWLHSSPSSTANAISPASSQSSLSPSRLEKNRNLSHSAATFNAKEKQPCNSSEASEFTNHQALFQLGGSKKASYVALIEVIQDQTIIFGPERELLIKIMQALGINLKTDFLLIAAQTNRRLQPLASRELYNKKMSQMISEIQPKLIFSFGLHLFSILFQQECKGTELLNTTFFPNFAPRVPVIQLCHLQDLFKNPDLKRATWNFLKPTFHSLTTDKF